MQGLGAGLGVCPCTRVLVRSDLNPGTSARTLATASQARLEQEQKIVGAFDETQSAVAIQTQQLISKNGALMRQVQSVSWRCGLVCYGAKRAV